MTKKQWYDIRIGTTRVKTDITMYANGTFTSKEITGTVHRMNSNWSQCTVLWDHKTEESVWYGRTQLEIL